MISVHRYLSPQKWAALINAFPYKLPTSIIGYSVLNAPIYAHQIGNGSKKVLLWSQMHGNESTTTRALLDLFNYLHTEQGQKLTEDLTLMIIPQLNPDGSAAYTRLNANKVDLNRDAHALTQPESIALNKIFETFQPDFCFNLHGQRTIFAAGKNGKPATLSFLAPAADSQRSQTPERGKAMQLIAKINEGLQKDIPNHVGRYDDTFNPNCVGDRFTSLGVPTLLYEAGHYQLDYDRNFTKEMVLKALITGLNSIRTEDFLDRTLADYEKIPENEKEYVDLIIQGVDIKTAAGIFRHQELAIQYKEEKKAESVFFDPLGHSFAQKLNLLTHRRVNANEILKNNLVDFAIDKSIEIF
jgi:hypothetical protein